MFNQDVFPVGAVAGLAIAIIFTWRIFSSALETREPNVSSSSGVNSQSNAAVISSGASGLQEDLQARCVVDDIFQPVKPALAQIVKQKLCEGRKVTCSLIGVILEETSPEELQKKATVRSSVLEVLSEIAKLCDIYFMERVLDDDSEKRVMLALQEAGVLTSGWYAKDKVLFCSTENGRTSFVRQLEPDWHIDTNHDIISQLARFIKYQLHISPSKPERLASNVFSSTSLEHFFGCT